MFCLLQAGDLIFDFTILGIEGFVTRILYLSQRVTDTQQDVAEKEKGKGSFKQKETKRRRKKKDIAPCRDGHPLALVCLVLFMFLFSPALVFIFLRGTKKNSNKIVHVQLYR